MGDGPKRIELERKAENLPCYFTGMLKYPEMVWILNKCDIALNPIMKGAAQSIINKHMDYAMAGLPVINTQECEEYRNMIVQYGAGINCRCNNSADIKAAIIQLMNDRQKQSEGSRKMGECEFDRAKTYNKICEVVVGKR